MNNRTLNRTDQLMRPPHRCCGVSTRKFVHTGPGRTPSFICDICGWSYRRDGTRKANNGKLKPTKMMA